MGAAIVAEALHSNLMVHMADILPTSIRVGRPDGTAELLLERGTRLPAQADFETPPGELRAVLLRGESGRASENTFLGALALPQPDSAETARASVKVMLKVSGDGILSVLAYHPLTGEHTNLDLILNET